MPCSDLQACNSFSTGWGLTWMQQQSLGRPCWRVAAAQSIRRSIRARYSARVSAPPDSAVPAAIEAVRLKLGYISHVFTGHTAARLQGVHVPDRYTDVQVSLQWDALQYLHTQLTQEQLHPGPIQSVGRGQLAFAVQLQGTPVHLQSDLNTVVSLEPWRIQVTDPASKQQYWCESLLSIRDGAAQDLAAAVDARIQELQLQLTADNAQAWSQSEAEGAWINRLGPPEQTAQWICQDPWLRLGRPLFKHLPEQLSGLRVINLMGSNGTKAVAAAVLGAQCTCVDISPVNARYCGKVAAAAGVTMDFVVADVLNLPSVVEQGTYDVVLLEMGVLHYFLDLRPLFDVVQQLLAPGGRLLLRDFHPVTTKLITSKGRRHKVTGDYFSPQLASSSVAYSKYAAGNGSAAAGGASQSVKLRQWGLGEVITAVCASGLRLLCLEEEPGMAADHAGLPKQFTAVAVKQQLV